MEDIEEADETDYEWAQLRRMEKLMKLQRMRLQQQGVLDPNYKDEGELQWHSEAEDHLDEVEEDSWDYETLLRQEIPDSDSEDEEDPQWHSEAEDYLDEVEEDSLDRTTRI